MIHIMLVPLDDRDYRERVMKDLQGIGDANPDELGERLGHLTQNAESAEKDSKNPYRTETRRIIAQGIRKVLGLLKGNPEKITEKTLKNMGVISVEGIDGYTTLYADVSIITDHIIFCAQREGRDMSKVFVIKEYWSDEHQCWKTLKRYMWDTDNQQIKDVTSDVSAREFFMEKMNPT